MGLGKKEKGVKTELNKGTWRGRGEVAQIENGNRRWHLVTRVKEKAKMKGRREEGQRWN